MHDDHCMQIYLDNASDIFEAWPLTTTTAYLQCPIDFHRCQCFPQLLKRNFQELQVKVKVELVHVQRTDHSN